MSDQLLMLVAVGATCGAIGFIVGLFSGYEHGVKDTERRWSEAVSRANYQRELERWAKS